MSSLSETVNAYPLLFRMAWRIRKSPTATGTRSPSADVSGFLKKSADFFPCSNARIIGAHPSDWTAIILGR